MSRSRKDPNNQPGFAPREVNGLLHTLRGEQFRHTQNIRRSKAHLAAIASRTYNDPSLPFSDIYKYADASSGDRSHEEEEGLVPLPVIHEGELQHGYPRGPVPGPPVPKSWSGLFRRDPVQNRMTIAFRREALSLVFSYIPWSFGSSDVPVLRVPTELAGRPSATATQGAQHSAESLVPPLAQICLKVILAEFPDPREFQDELLPFLPPHLHRDVLRYTAVHDPLPTSKLYTLCGPEGLIDGELIVVGPQAMLQRDALVSSLPTLPTHRGSDNGDEDAEDHAEGAAAATPASSSEALQRDAGEEAREDIWDVASTYSQDASPPLHTLIILNASVSTPMLFVFPPTITRLALLALPAPAQVHRLPRICPLLEVLDLSYNPWLNDLPSRQGRSVSENIIDRIEWEKWARLQVLGLRECSVPESIVARVNRGRMEEEVVVIGVNERTFDTRLSAVEGTMKSLRLSE